MAQLDSGGSDGSTSDDGTTDTTSNSFALQSLGLGWIAQYEDVLRAFGKRPVQFVAGAIFTLLLDGVEEMMTAILTAILALGDSVASVPTLVASVLTDAGSTVGMSIIETIRLVNEPLLAAAQATGPFAPLVGTAIVAGEVIVVVWVGQLTVRVLLDTIPGLGGLV